jgi:hypothetical protein
VAIKVEFHARAGWLWGRKEGYERFVPVASAVTPFEVITNPLRRVWALGVRGVNFNNEPVEFRLLARELFGPTIGLVEQAFAEHKLVVDHLPMLVGYLRKHLPVDGEPVQDNSLPFADGDQTANRFFRGEFLKQRKAVLGKHFSFL